jgi:hypothetical protein
MKFSGAEKRDAGGASEISGIATIFVGSSGGGDG